MFMNVILGTVLFTAGYAWILRYRVVRVRWLDYGVLLWGVAYPVVGWASIVGWLYVMRVVADDSWQDVLGAVAIFTPGALTGVLIGLARQTSMVCVAISLVSLAAGVLFLVLTMHDPFESDRSASMNASLFTSCIGWNLGVFISVYRATRAVPGRCPECSYDLRGLASDRCPECGTPIGADQGRAGTNGPPPPSP